MDLLLPHPDGVNGEDVSKALGVDPRGVSGYILSLVNWGAQRGLKKKQMVARERRANGHGRMVRRIMLTTSFRKMIEAGEVPEVKLDQ